ncbi:MAG: hypothetical protein ACJ735_16620 [Actinomycetes bacterium]
MRATARFVRPLAAAAAAALVVPAAIAFAPVASATTAKDAGDALSTATLLELSAGGALNLNADVRSGVRAKPNVTSLGAPQTVQAVVASLGASTIQKPSAAAVDVIPVILNGTGFGEQKVTNSTQNIAGGNASAPGAVGVTTPGLVATASTKNGPVASLTSTGRYTASLLGVNLNAFDGSLSFGSSVLNKTSSAGKLVHIANFQLPTLSELLGALGININQLSQNTLRSLVDGLHLVTAEIASAEDAVDQIAAAEALVAQKTTALDAAIANADFTTGAVQTVLTTLGISAPTNASEWQALTGAQQTALEGALGAAGTAIHTANTALVQAQTALTNLINSLGALADSLTGLLLNALDVPLLSIGDLRVGTAATAGGNHVAQVTGSVKGLKVLGTELVTSTDILNITDKALATVQSKIDALTGVVGSVLTGAGLSGIVGTLTVPAPKITLLQKTTSLSPNAGYQAALARITGAAVSWGAITVPLQGVLGARPHAVHARPTASIDDNGNLVTDPISVTVADVTDSARYAPAAATTPSTVTPATPQSTNPGLAATGVSTGVAVGALLLLFAAYGVRRLRWFIAD